MAAAGATPCSAAARSSRIVKEWRESVKYLRSIDRARLMRRCGSVLTISMAALRQVKEKSSADQRHQQKKAAAADCSNKGVTQSSRTNRAGNRLERRQKERNTRESLRDQRTIAQILAKSLNPIEGGSESRNLATTGKLQILQQICGNSSGSNGSTDPVKKTSPEYVGIIPQLSDRIDGDEDEGQGKRAKENKTVIRTVEDGLLMVVSASIYGRKIRTLIDSGATRCFVSPACVAACGLKGVPVTFSWS